MRRLWVIPLVLALAGCFSAHLPCPANGSITASSSGNGLGAALLPFIQTGQQVAPMLMAKGTTASDTPYVDCKGPDLFAETCSCTATVPAPAPAPVIVVAPAGPPAPQILH